MLLRERPLKGLLGGMLETPSSPWAEEKGSDDTGTGHAPLKADWKKLPGLVEHTFTHFHLELSVYRAEVGLDAAPKRVGVARALPLAHAARACRRGSAVSDAEGALSRAARGRASPGAEARLRLRLDLAARRFAQNIDRLEPALSLVMPEGPAVAGERPLHMGADLVDRALGAGAGDRAVGADLSLVPRTPDRRALCRVRSAQARPERRRRCGARRACPWRLAASPCRAGRGPPGAP